MAEQPATTTNKRPAQYRVTKGQPKNAVVEVMEWQRDGALVRDQKTGASYSKRMDSLERVFRTKQEEELGRDFTEEEAAEHERVMKIRVAQHMVEHRAKSINDRLAQMAERLDRAAEDMRRLATSEHHRLDEKVYQAQHDLAWLFPNLGTDSLTTDLVGWLQMDAEIKRLGGVTGEAES
jgi:hypothetical protein